MKIYRLCNVALAFVLSFHAVDAQEVRQGSVSNAKSRSNLTGKVTDAVTGEPIAGASIYFSDIKAGGVSNDSGIFKLQHFPSGRYLIEVSHLGYASVIEHVELKG